MSERTRTGLHSLLAALLLGILGDYLLRETMPGLNFLLWIGALAGATALVARRSGLALAGEGRWLLAAAVLFAAGLAWRAAEPLLVFDVLAVLICLGLAALTLRGGNLTRSGLVSYAAGLVWSGILHLAAPFQLLLEDIKWAELPKSRWQEQLSALIRGLLLALPLLLLFGLLFMAADRVFETLVTQTLSFDLPLLISHLFLAGFAGFLAAGFLRTSLYREPTALPHLERPSGLGLGAIEVGTILGTLNALFLAFVLVQLRYLFGGAELVLNTVAMTYAEYARSGFFELVTVAGLVLPVLLMGHWLIPPEQATGQRLFRWLGGALVAQLYLIMGSALQRMLLYQREYGLTEPRLFTTAFMGWMALLFAWFLFTVLRGRRERFAVGALASGLLVLAALHLANPDLLILRTNLELRERTGRFDAQYAASLGPDAIPLLMATLPDLTVEEQAVITARLVETKPELAQWGWRSFNWGRWAALRALAPLPDVERSAP